MAAFLNEAYPVATRWQAYQEFFGENGTVILTGGFDTMADLDAFMKWAGENEAFKAMDKKGDEAGVQEGRPIVRLYQIL